MTIIKSIKWGDEEGQSADIGADAKNVFIQVGENKISLQDFFKNYESMVETSKYIHIDDKEPTRNQEHIIWIDTKE